MAEQVTRIRMVDSGELDRYGKPILTKVSTEHRAHAFAPTVTAEDNGVEQSFSTDGGTLYFRIPHITDAQPDDQFIVRGTTYDVEGPSALWVHPTGRVKGSVIILTRAEVIHG